MIVESYFNISIMFPNVSLMLTTNVYMTIPIVLVLIMGLSGHY